MRVALFATLQLALPPFPPPFDIAIAQRMDAKGKMIETGDKAPPAATPIRAPWLDQAVFVAGTTPQIITETLWALDNQTPGYAPRSLHVITTLRGRDVTRRKLIDEGRLARLCEEFGLKNAPNVEFHLLKGKGGRALEDVRDTSENTALANTILGVTRELTSDQTTRLSASLSGGRKSMGFFMGYAMSLFGRQQDALYHVMTPPEWERIQEFYYIPREPVMMLNANGQEVSTASARIELAEIPFLRLRHSVKEPILQTQVIDVGVLTRSFQASLDRPILRLITDECRVSFGDLSFTLRPQLFALYRVFVQACASGVPGVGPGGLGEEQTGWLSSIDFATAEARGARAYLQTLEQTLRVSDSTFAWTRDYMRSWGDGSKASRIRMAKLFNPIFARLREALSQVVTDPSSRRSIWLHTEGRNPTRYGLLLEPDQIELEG